MFNYFYVCNLFNYFNKLKALYLLQMYFSNN